MKEECLLSKGQHKLCLTKWSIWELISSAKFELCHIFFDSYFFPFLGPTADKTCFAKLEELKKEHKMKHHSSVVGFYSLSFLQSKFKNAGFEFTVLVLGSFIDSV